MLTCSSCLTYTEKQAPARQMMARNVCIIHVCIIIMNYDFFTLRNKYLKCPYLNWLWNEDQVNPTCKRTNCSIIVTMSNYNYTSNIHNYYT